MGTKKKTVIALLESGSALRELLGDIMPALEALGAAQEGRAFIFFRETSQTAALLMGERSRSASHEDEDYPGAPGVLMEIPLGASANEKQRRERLIRGQWPVDEVACSADDAAKALMDTADGLTLGSGEKELWVFTESLMLMGPDALEGLLDMKVSFVVSAQKKSGSGAQEAYERLMNTILGPMKGNHALENWDQAIARLKARAEEALIGATVKKGAAKKGSGPAHL